MKIRTQLIALIVLLLFIFSLAFFMIRDDEKKTALFLFKNESIEKKDVFEKLLQLQSRSAHALAFDYTYWDEMVDFLKTKDPEWAHENLGVNTLSTYQVNSLWVYDTAASLVYSFNDPDKKALGSIPLPEDALIKIFEKSPFTHFFVQTPEGFWEIHGASIHPSNDPERKTKPAGYFFDGRLWDLSYLNELEKLVSAKIKLASFNLQEKPGDIFDDKNATITFFKELNGWDGKALMLLEVNVRSRETKEFGERSQKYLVLFLIFAVGITGIIVFFSVTAIGIPLNSISKALSSGSASFLRKTRKSRSEFGEISQLIEKFFEQKRRLTEEIAERERVEWQIKESAQEWEKTFNSISDLVFLMDKDCRIIRANKAVFDFLKTKPEELLGKKCFELVHHTESNWPNCPFQKVRKDGLAHTEEALTFNGIPLLATVSPVFDDKGEVVGAVHIAKDITDLKKAEAELRGERDLSQHYFEISKAIMIVLDPEQKVMLINQAGCDFLGFAKNEIIGKNWFDHFIPESVRGSLRTLFGDLVAGKIKQGEYHENPVLLRDGSQKIIAWHNALLRDEQQRIVGLLGSGEDVTERADFEQKLQEKIKELEKFNKIAIDREMKMIELKEKLKAFEEGKRNA